MLKKNHFSLCFPHCGLFRWQIFIFSKLDFNFCLCVIKLKIESHDLSLINYDLLLAYLIVS